MESTSREAESAPLNSIRMHARDFCNPSQLEYVLSLS
jgi:hypothetical protein